MKTCSTCKADRPASEYHRSASTTDGLDPRCKPCRKTATQRHAIDPQRKRDASMRRLYGIGVAEYDAMFEDQGGLCAICGMTEQMTRLGVTRGLCVDHDHETGRVRGLLCAACNFAIGKFQDDPARLRAAAEYLER